MIKTLSLLLVTSTIGLCSPVDARTNYFQIAKATQDNTQEIHDKNPVQTRSDIKDLKAGDYLASRFAQTRHDWKSASLFIKPILTTGIWREEITQRAMILAMGAGEVKKAINLAKQAKNLAPDKKNTIADTFLLIDAFKKKDYIKSKAIFDQMDNDATMRFVGPYIRGWIDAALGKSNIDGLKQNTMQLYHAILISDFLNDHEDVGKMINMAMKVDEITPSEIERIADLYSHVGMTENAIELYERVLKTSPEDNIIKEKIKNLKEGTNAKLFKKIKTPQEGMAQAFYDVSRILYNEQNDESARVFAYISLYLSPDMSQTKFLLASINTRHKQYKEAIDLYKSIPEGDDDYIQAQYNIVDIYDDTEQMDKALSILNNLAKGEKKPDVLIKIGNLYRHREQFQKALDMYNRAAKELGGKITKEYWTLHYVRGIAYEQLKQWDKAEKELKAAIKLQPDHPYVLNYLGYSWVDRNINLDEATKMIQKAVNARPNDGYITDSLGWAMYRNADYHGAVKVLERAVELLPYDPTINDHLGDAYWRVGRKLEARYQWNRAVNNSDDEKQIKEIKEKISSGILKDI